MLMKQITPIEIVSRTGYCLTKLSRLLVSNHWILRRWRTTQIAQWAPKLSVNRLCQQMRARRRGRRQCFINFRRILRKPKNFAVNGP